MTRFKFGSILLILFLLLFTFSNNVRAQTGVCDELQFPGALQITEQTAALTWAVPTALTGATFEVEVLETGMVFTGTPNYSNIATPPFVVGGLLPGKTYKFRVRARCTAALASNWSVEERFRTILTNPQCELQLHLADTSCAPETNQFRIRVDNVPGVQLGTDVQLQAVRFTMTHTWASDMAISLVSPTGVRVRLVDSLLTGGNHFGDIADINCNNYTELSSSCALRSIKDAQSPFIGTFFPVHSLSLFNDGSNPNGIWTLEACDRFANDRGILQYVELVFEPMSCTAPSQPIVTNISLNSAQVIIPNGMGCDSLIIEYGPRGFRPGNGATAGPNGTLKLVPCGVLMGQIGGLLQFTEYSAYIRKKCANGLYSPNSCRTDFFTDCSFPSEEETFNAQPNCSPICAAACPITGHWENVSTDHFDWTTTSAMTPTNATGPDTDFEGGGKFAYIEVSGTACGLTRTAVLQSHCLNVVDQPGDCDMGFAYHMFGVQTGTLKLDASTNGGTTWTTLWQKTGNLGNQWNRQKLDLAAFHNQQVILRFSATSANGGAGDIAIDNIRFFGATFENQGAYTYFRDTDADGFGSAGVFIKSCSAVVPAGYVVNSNDCNDANPNIWPGAQEIYCNGIDENCNGMADDAQLPAPVVSNVTICADSPVSLSAVQPRGTVYWYQSGTNQLLGTGTQISFNPNIQVPVGIASATINVVAKDSLLGCPGAFDTVSVQMLARPDLRLLDQVELCIGQSFTLSQLPINDQRQANGLIKYYSGAQLSAAQLISVSTLSPVVSTTIFAVSETPLVVRIH